MLASVRDANASGAARRRQRRLRQWLRDERLSVAMALAECQHHSAPRGQKKARAGGGAREDVHGEAPDEAPPPEEPGTQYYGLDDNDSVPELSGGWPGPVLDPGPPVAGERHRGVGYEILLDVRVPQLGRDTKDFPHVMELYFWEQLWRHGVVSDSVAARRLAVDVPKHKAEWEQPVQVARGSRSSNKVGGRRKRKKRRKKKLPKTSSSTSSRCRERNQGAVEYAEDGEDEVTIEYEQRENSSSVSWLDLGDAVVDDVQECFADEAGAGFSWLRVGNKLSGDVRGLSGGTPEACLTDRHEVSSCGPCVPGAQKSWVSLAVQCQAAQLPKTSRRCMPVPLDGPGRKRSGSKDVVLERDTHGGWGVHQSGQVCCLHLHAAMTVAKRRLSKRYLPRR